ncbi:MAG: autoinducer binding domain-containing protein [Devosiaceae bacterium]|nr:autoinducer binding domain-containing protein [Devosiaceae bacterium]
MRIYSVTDFTADLTEASSDDSVWRSSVNFFNQFGIDGLVYLDADGANFTLKSTLPKSWHQHYVDSNYHKIDSFAQICCTGTSPTPVLTGADNLDLYPHLSSSQKTLVQEAGETGFKAGFSSCFRPASAKGFGGWNLMDSKGKKSSDATIKEHGDLLHLAAFCAHQALAKTPRSAPKQVLVRAKQSVCNRWQPVCALSKLLIKWN